MDRARKNIIKVIKHFGFHTNKETYLKVIGFQIYNLIQTMVQVNITDYPETVGGIQCILERL